VESPNKVKYVAVFAFSPAILLRCSLTGMLNKGALCVNEIMELIVFIFHNITSVEELNSFGKFCGDQLGKGVIYLD
jgi:hypothetical protein